MSGLNSDTLSKHSSPFTAFSTSKFFDSKLIDNIPTYEYKLENGISHERLGMYILKNEKIIEILDSMTKKEYSAACNK